MNEIECSLAVNIGTVIVTGSALSERGKPETIHRKMYKFRDPIDASVSCANLRTCLDIFGWTSNQWNHDFNKSGAAFFWYNGNGVELAKLRVFVDAYFRMLPSCLTTEDFWDYVKAN
jgi:hypothetical protein